MENLLFVAKILVTIIKLIIILLVEIDDKFD